MHLGVIGIERSARLFAVSLFCTADELQQTMFVGQVEALLNVSRDTFDIALYSLNYFQRDKGHGKKIDGSEHIPSEPLTMTGFLTPSIATEF